MGSLIPGYEYDIFISYRQKDNKHDGWVTEFVNQLKGELESTFKEDISVYFDINPHDGLLETHDVDASLKEKLKCLVFIPIISRTYCDSKSFAWEHEFKAFINQASGDQFGLKVKLPNGNVANRVLPVQIHDLYPEDKASVEKELGGVLRAIEFIYKEPGVNKPLSAKDNEDKNTNKTNYRIQINKVANAIAEIIYGLRSTKMAPAGRNIQPDQEASIAKEGGVNELQMGATLFGKNIKRWIVSGLLVFFSIVFIFGIFKVIENSKQAKDNANLEKSIAVLPFINDSPDANQENTPFVNGLMEEILINLQTIKEFRVPGRTTVEQYRNVFDKSVSEKAMELGVNYVVEGSVQKYGDRFRVRVQLIKAIGKETHLWAKSYEQEIRSTNDIFNIQNQIAQAIASELKAVISPEEKLIMENPSTKNLESYYYYQRGREEFSKFKNDNTKSESLDISEDFYKNALKNDKKYARAYLGLADVYWAKHFKKDYFSLNFIDSVLVLANKAISCDPNLADAYSLRGDYYKGNGKHQHAEEEYQKALSLNPSSWQVYVNLSDLYLRFLGDPVKAFDNLSNAISLNHGKELPGLYGMLGWYYDAFGFFDEAIYYYSKSLSLTKDSAGYLQSLAYLELRRNKYVMALKYAERSFYLDSSNYELLRQMGLICIGMGDVKNSLKYYKRYIARCEALKLPWVNFIHHIGYAYLRNGYNEKAMEYFNLHKRQCENLIKLNRGITRIQAFSDLIQIYSALGEKDKAIEALRDYNNEIGDFEALAMLWFKRDYVIIDNIRNEPEYKEIIAQMEAKYKRSQDLIRQWQEEKGIEIKTQ